jgi:large subunit ribosomal protein L10
MARPDKVQAVEDIEQRFERSEAALLTDYRGLKVTEMAEVRGALRDAEADYKVLKNTLARIAVGNLGLGELTPMFEGPTAIAFCRGDAVAAAKALEDAARRFPVLAVKGGVLRGVVIDAGQARELASLESREVQLARLAVMASSPLQAAANVLGALQRSLASMLAQVVAQREEEAAGPTGPKEE